MAYDQLTFFSDDSQLPLASDPEYRRQRFAQKKANGVCRRCSNPFLPGKTLCAACLEKLSEEQKRIRARRKAKGQCQRCTRPLGPDDTDSTCWGCGAYSAARHKKGYLARRLAKICVYCGRCAVQGRIGCDECVTKQRDYTKWLLANGRCKCCGYLRERGKECCNKCLEKRKQKRWQFKLRVFERYGGAFCVCCGESRLQFLELDHINNDGASHRQQIREEGRAFSIYRWLQKHDYPECGLRVLCSNCNQGRRRWNGICPHQKEPKLPYTFIA